MSLDENVKKRVIKRTIVVIKKTWKSCRFHELFNGFSGFCCKLFAFQSSKFDRKMTFKWKKEVKGEYRIHKKQLIPAY